MDPKQNPRRASYRASSFSCVFCSSKTAIEMPHNALEHPVAEA